MRPLRNLFQFGPGSYTHGLFGVIFYRHVGEPVVTVFLLALNNGEELALQRQGDRPGFTVINIDFVDRLDRGDFGCGSAEENFV